jgi:hypothetical protein
MDCFLLKFFATNHIGTPMTVGTITLGKHQAPKDTPYAAL